jgi:hypothetical protein
MSKPAPLEELSSADLAQVNARLEVSTGQPVQGGRDLTERQLEILRFLFDYQLRYGRPATVRAVCQEFGFTSPNGGASHLKALDKKGYVLTYHEEGGSSSMTKVRLRGLRWVPEFQHDREGLNLLLALYRSDPDLGLQEGGVQAPAGLGSKEVREGAGNPKHPAGPRPRTQHEPDPGEASTKKPPQQP